MKKRNHLQSIISFFLFTGLLFNLTFIYFQQERLYSQITTGSIALGPEKYLRIISVICIFVTVLLAIFSARKKYHFSVFFAYLTIIAVLTINYLVSGADFFDMTQFMSNRGIGTWVCLGLIFVGSDDQRYNLFKKFLNLSILFISVLTIYNLVDFGIGNWRGQALSKYQVYAVNMVWLAPYVFLMSKENQKLKHIRLFFLFMGIILALICQTRSFLIIYFITLLFDFFHTKKKSKYSVAILAGFLGFAYLILNTPVLNSSLDLLLNRGITDTRSTQLAVFISQLNFFEVITGSGFFSSYKFGDSSWYSVDNQWFYLLWWGGLIPVLSYFYLCAIIPIKMMVKRNISYETKTECFVLILWVLGLTGLAIYSTMSVEFFFFVISIILGRVLFKFSRG